MAISALRPVVLVDDSDDELHLLKRHFAKAGVKNPVVTFDDPRDAISFLRAASHTPDSGLLPCVVFTDLKMPGMDGIQFVKWIREQKRLAALTVIMLSNSALDADRKRAKAAGVDSYYVKLPKLEIIAKIVADASTA